MLREIVDEQRADVPRSWWQDDILSRYLAAVAELGAVIPVGRLGLYKYTTMDSTLAMAQRLVRALGRYLEGAPAERVKILREVRAIGGTRTRGARGADCPFRFVALAVRAAQAALSLIASSCSPGSSSPRTSASSPWSCPSLS
jgi:hypothetical protein